MTRRLQLLLALVFASALSLRASNFVVGGVVVDSQSRKPLAHALVSLAPATARSQKLEQVTKPDGRFSFVVDLAGKYTLQISKPGYPVQTYKRSGIGGLSSAIVVRDDQDTNHIVFDANRGAVITGQIKDEDSEPADGVFVSAYQMSVVGGERKIILRGQARANAAGEFRLWNLPAGSYYVCAMGRPWFADSVLTLEQMQESMSRASQQRVRGTSIAVPPEPDNDDPPAEPEPEQSAPKYSPDPSLRGTAYMPTFYPRAPTMEEASPVRVENGGEAQVPITLPFSRAVSVKGTISFSAEMSAGRVNLFKKFYDQYALFLQETVSKEGIFQFRNVPSGSYEIVGTSDSGSGASSWHTRQQVEVGAPTWM